MYTDGGYIERLLNEAVGADQAALEKILDKAENFYGLAHNEVAALLKMDDNGPWERVFNIAGKIKARIYGDRVVMFAPLYVSDYCVNNCAYCGFAEGRGVKRRKLTMDEIRAEVNILENMGHKRIALEAGEDPVNAPLSYILDALQAIYSVKGKSGGIRRVNVNIAATDTDSYRQLKAAGIGTYILFQETYHRPTYESVHGDGPKKDYVYHSTAFDRAMDGGLDDVGGGALFGLYDSDYEVIGLMLHSEYLEEKYGAGFHTISLPRIRKAEGRQTNWPHAVSDEKFLKLAAVVRLAVPYTGIIISTRETPEMRRRLISCGVSQLSGGSAVEVGGYSLREKNAKQFNVMDGRTPQDILLWLMDEGLVPSFCTACYRSGRTGDRFMALAKSGGIKNVCAPNALITLAEYASDYGSEQFRSKALALIDKKISGLDTEAEQKKLRETIERILSGERDLFV
ncbi:MAG: [FeFe] hydrogenase H-cluster radical SAM maturase HydG [Defluviitaleaceae bacterium]|nr:[FeFe] hydrogenase H-cluster radical SAM maturase HydG [Defluviitaleaceae bacterium]